MSPGSVSESTAQTEAPQDGPPVASTNETAASSSNIAASASQSPFPAAAARPTQEGPLGIRFDFNFGARFALPEGAYRAQLRDLNTGNILYQIDRGGVSVHSAKRFFVRFGIDVWNEQGELVFTHQYSARDKDVLIILPVGTLGDSIGWFPYVARFAQLHGCKLTCAMSELLIPIFAGAYPDITFVPHSGIDAEKFYATYYLGLFFDDEAFEWQPTDFRIVGLHRSAGYILGVDPAEERPRLSLPDSSRPIEDPYVCIAVQATTHAKKWNNPHGWSTIVAWLKARGYRVICIDREPVHGFGIVWTHIPHGVEDETGERPLTERARWLMHAEFFIGGSSGLSWLAWAVDTPVVMISGFTHPVTEFHTQYRVINWHTCNGCWNDVRHRFDHHDYLWCPRHKGTDRMFECTRLIAPEQVIRTIESIPSVARSATPASASMFEVQQQDAQLIATAAVRL
jgi:autotransporter strand-loop-strand O-heptosyltransferase